MWREDAGSNPAKLIALARVGQTRAIFLSENRLLAQLPGLSRGRPSTLTAKKHQINKPK